MSYILETFFTPLLIIGWYAANIGVLLLNKYLLSYYGFKFPAFLTMCHMLSCSICTYACSRLKVVDTKRVTSRAQLVKIAVLASVFCISIVLGNISLRYIPVSFNQAIGATTPFFTAVLGFILVGERETFFVYASLIPVVGGIIMASGGEPLFNLFGFGAAMTATGARALKTVLQGILLSQVGDRLDSMSLLMYMSPIAATLLLPATLLMEGNVVQQVRDSAATYPWMLPMLAANSFMAFFANLANFLVTKHTSPLTLQVLGNAKGVVAACISVLLFHNPITVQGCAGFLITVTGVICYSQAKKATSAGQHTKPNGKTSPGVIDPLLPVSNRQGLRSP